MVENRQHTVTWHVDDLKSSHVNPKGNDNFYHWLNWKYASDDIGKVKAVRGKRHEYLTMILDFTEPGVLRIDMRDYVKGMIDNFSEKLSGKTKGPWNENLFKVDESSPKLENEETKFFHTFTMKAMFVCKRGRQDIQPAVAFLSTRTREPTMQDWNKLIKMMNYLNATKEDVAHVSADDNRTIRCYVDVAFAIHKDYKSHTGGIMTLGMGSICSASTKQKVNAKSSTESELIGVDDEISKKLWTKRFIEAQGHKVNANIVCRDNTSSMKLEANGKASSGKRTRHFHIKYFYFTDLIQRNEIQIEYCRTNDMIGDYMTKPLTGAKFTRFRNKIMGVG